MANFPSSGKGDPVRSQVRIAWQATEGLPATTGYVDTYHYGAPIAVEPSNLAAQVILSGSSPAQQLRGKFNIPSSSLELGDLDPGSLAQKMLMASVLEGVSTSNPESGRYRSVLGSSGSAPAEKLLTVQTDPDSGHRWRFADGRPSGYTINGQSGQNLTLSVPLVLGKFDLWGDVAQTAGTGSTKPHLRHFWAGNLGVDSVDQDLYVKVVTVNAGSLVVEPKVSAAETYAAQQTIAFDTYTDLADQDGAPIGWAEQPIQIYLPTGSYTANDVFKIPMRRTRWSPTFGTRRVLTETQARFYLGGVETPIDTGWTLTTSFAGVTTLSQVGSAQPLGTQKVGPRVTTLQVSRQFRDIVFERAALLGEPVSVVIVMRTNHRIGSTSKYFQEVHILPSVTVAKPSFSVAAGGQNRDEQITLTAGKPASAFSYDGVSITDEYAVIVDNDIASIV